jgi:hypothetical protein
MIASEDGRDLLRSQSEGPRERAGALGRALADSMLARGVAAVAALRPAREGSV